MSCDRTAGGLVAYHFGVVEVGTRASVEEHLLECRACLGSFLVLKRDIELSASSEAVPSARARARLREAVAKNVERRHASPRNSKAASTSSWRETALSFGLAGVAVVCAFVITTQIAMSGGSKPRGAAAIAEVSP